MSGCAWRRYEKGIEDEGFKAAIEELFRTKKQQ
jgi:hypothetical protein